MKKIFAFSYNKSEHFHCPWDEDEHGEEREFEVEIPDNISTYEVLLKDDETLNSVTLEAGIDIEEINKDAEFNQYRYCYLKIGKYTSNIEVHSKYDASDVLVFSEVKNEDKPLEITLTEQI